MPVTKARANTTTIPMITSYANNFLLKKIGSIRAEKKEAVAKQTTATETVDAFIDSKKHNQCIVTRAPTPNISKKFFLLIENSCFLKNKKIAKLKKAIPILYQTRWIVSKDIIFPRMPVNPNITTIR